MVDQAREDLCYQRKTYHLEVLNIERGRSCCNKICLENCAFLLAVNHMNNGMFFIVVLSHRKLDLRFFFHGRASYRLPHIWLPALKLKGGSEVKTSSNQN